MSIEANREHRRAANKYLQEQNQRWPAHLIRVPMSEWPKPHPYHLIKAWRSRDYLVQVFDAQPSASVRLSVNRTAVTTKGAWAQDIPWEDLQRLKSEAGFGDFDAVEVFPRDADVVNVANMRHLWVLPGRLPFAWRRI